MHVNKCLLYFHELKSLYNGASYQNTDGRKVLYLNGSRHSYAETPALPIRAISFSIMCWIKVLSLPSNPLVHIYSDWQNHISLESIFTEVVQFLGGIKFVLIFEILMDVIWFISVAGKCLRYTFCFPTYYE